MRRKRKYRISVVPLSTLEGDPKSLTVISSAVFLFFMDIDVYNRLTE